MIQEIKKLTDSSLLAELKNFPNQGVLQEIIEHSRSGKMYMLEESAILVMENCSDPFVFIAGHLTSESVDLALVLLKNFEFPMLCCLPKFHSLFLNRGWNVHLRTKLSLKNRQAVRNLDPNLNIQPIKTASIFEKCSWHKERAELYTLADNFLRYGTGYALCRGEQVLSEAYANIGGGYAEIGVITHPDYRGKGYATQVVSHLIEHCFNHDIVPQWSCNADNRASMKTGLNLGFEIDDHYIVLVPNFGNVLCSGLVGWLKENSYNPS